MTTRQRQLQVIYETMKKIDALFQYPESITRYVGRAVKSEEDTNAYLNRFKNYNLDIDDHIDVLKNHLSEWTIRFDSKPDLKDAYIKLGKRLKTYIDKYDPPKYHAFNERIKISRMLKPLIEPLEIKRPAYIPEDEIEDYRIEIESRFLIRQAQRDGDWNYKLEDLKAELTNAVSSVKLISQEYDGFLANKLILEHMDDASDADIFKVPYNKLSSFIQRSEYYLG